MMLPLLAVALSSPARAQALPEYELLTDRDIQKHLVLVPADAPAGPEGIAVTWSSDASQLTATVANRTEAVVRLNWAQSVYTDTAGNAVPIVPGSARRRAYTDVLPSVLPTGSQTEEPLLRADKTGSRNVEQLAVPDDVGSQVQVTLAIEPEGGETQWLRQSFEVRADLLALDALEQQKAYNNELLAVRGEISRAKTTQKTGAVLAGVGALLALVAIPAENSDGVPRSVGERAAFAGIGVAAVGGGAAVAIVGTKNRTRARKELRELEKNPPN